MMRHIYNIFVWVYGFGIYVASIYNVKARKWIAGRKTQKDLWTKIKVVSRPIWFHCSSLGEFEQARPLMELIKKETDQKVLLTFFSPSGYEIRADYVHADWIFYLPLDTKINAAKWIDRFNPQLFILTKYDFWWNYIDACQSKKIPIVLISALFREGHYYFSGVSRYFEKRLKHFDHIFNQDSSSFELLKQRGFKNISQAADTRIDRVLAIRQNAKTFESIEKFCKNQKIIILGSSWNEEEQFILDWHAQNPNNCYKFIIAPHDVSEEHVQSILAYSNIQFSRWSAQPEEITTDFLIIDKIGMLAHLYKYAWLAIVGGGFKKNIHNILEPMAFHLPVLFGPNFKNFPEAVEMIEAGGAFVFNDQYTLKQIIEKLEILEEYQKSQSIMKSFLERNKGSSQFIFQYLRKNFHGI